MSVLGIAQTTRPVVNCLTCEVDARIALCTGSPCFSLGLLTVAKTLVLIRTFKWNLQVEAEPPRCSETSDDCHDLGEVADRVHQQMNLYSPLLYREV